MKRVFQVLNNENISHQGETAPDRVNSNNFGNNGHKINGIQHSVLQNPLFFAF
jgi:hypothetical protein